MSKQTKGKESEALPLKNTENEEEEKQSILIHYHSGRQAQTERLNMKAATKHTDNVDY